uniref:RxLR effector candidate protein n=1 Tax=Hyaloperonospora arabidopsidis (strain Emoy2) TaxID=559515 RepID=M4C3U7_HYAAE
MVIFTNIINLYDNIQINKYQRLITCNRLTPLQLSQANWIASTFFTALDPPHCWSRPKTCSASAVVFVSFAAVSSSWYSDEQRLNSTRVGLSVSIPAIPGRFLTPSLLPTPQLSDNRMHSTHFSYQRLYHRQWRGLGADG